jgi:hypothetical protein
MAALSVRRLLLLLVDVLAALLAARIGTAITAPASTGNSKGPNSLNRALILALIIDTLPSVLCRQDVKRSSGRKESTKSKNHPKVRDGAAGGRSVTVW